MAYIAATDVDGCAERDVGERHVGGKAFDASQLQCVRRRWEQRVIPDAVCVVVGRGEQPCRQ